MSRPTTQYLLSRKISSIETTSNQSVGRISKKRATETMNMDGAITKAQLHSGYDYYQANEQRMILVKN